MHRWRVGAVWHCGEGGPGDGDRAQRFCVSRGGACSDIVACYASVLSQAVPASQRQQQAAAPCPPQANPHKRLRQLYGPRMMAQYRGVPLGELSPHVYAIAEQARASTGRGGGPACQNPRALGATAVAGDSIWLCGASSPATAATAHAASRCRGWAGVQAGTTAAPPRVLVGLTYVVHCACAFDWRFVGTTLLSAQAYSAMMVDEAPQAILVSGESGAGKTESAKMVMQVRRSGAGGGGLL